MNFERTIEQMTQALSPVLSDDVIQYVITPYISNFFDHLDISIESGYVFEVYKNMYYTPVRQDPDLETSRKSVEILHTANLAMARETEDNLYYRYHFEVGVFCSVRLKSSKLADSDVLYQLLSSHYPDIDAEKIHEYTLVFRPMTIKSFKDVLHRNSYEWYTFFEITTEEEFVASKTESYRLELIHRTSREVIDYCSIE